MNKSIDRIITGKQTTTIWQFPKMSPRKQREGFYCEESMSHPAKMPTYLAQAIIDSYTKKGDLILDPMTGIGTTVIEAIKLGRNAIGIEYEKRFMDMSNKNLILTKEKLGNNAGTGLFIKGDARELSKTLSKYNFDSIIFSPPFANTLAGSSKDDTKKYKHGSAGKDYGDKDDLNQIGNLKHTQIDTIIFSPPYEEVVCNQANNDSELCKRKFGYMVPYSEKTKEKRPPSEINIGMQRGATYLGEMYKVYVECYKVLKPGNFMILVVKNFRRKGEEINLMANTIQLCKTAGFKFFQTCMRVLNEASFWQINNVKKTPYLMLNLTEYVLVFKKG